MQQRRRGHACSVLPIWCAGYIIVKSVRPLPTLTWWSMQPGHVCRPTKSSKAKIPLWPWPTLFWKQKKCPARLKMGKKWLDIYDADVHSNPPASQVRQRSFIVCSSLQVFSLCNSIFPGVILALLLHGLSSINYVHCKLYMLLAPTARQSDRHRRARGLAGFSRWRSTEQRRSWNCGAPSASTQRSTGRFTCDREKENVKKAQCWENMKRAKRLLAWQGSRWRRVQTRMSPTSLSEKTETWCSLIADSLAQNKPVVSIRHHNKELKRDPKTTRQTAATSDGKTELECSR